jgi:hypothetical protein
VEDVVESWTRENMVRERAYGDDLSRRAFKVAERGRVPHGTNHVPPRFQKQFHQMTADKARSSGYETTHGIAIMAV